MKHLSTAIITIALLSTPLAIWLEKNNYSIWNNQLVLHELQPEPNRHTLVRSEGKYLPRIIEQNLTLSSSEGPFLISGTINIQPTATLTIEPGTQILAHEFGQIINQGVLVINGTKQQPVTISTNELHPLNQTWSGIVSTPQSTTSITNAHIQHASPAITCQTSSTVSINNSLIEQGNLGVFSESQSCNVTDSIIKSLGDGVIYATTEPDLSNTTINAHATTIKKITNRDIL